MSEDQMPREIYLGRDNFHYIVPKSAKYGGIRYVRADDPEIVAALNLLQTVRENSLKEGAE